MNGTPLSQAKRAFADSLSAGLLKATGADHSASVGALTDEEVRLLLEAATHIHDPEAMKPLMETIGAHRDKVAAFFGGALGNGKLQYAVWNLWTKYWDAWLGMLQAKAYVNYNRSKLERFFRKTLGADVPALDLHIEVERSVFGRRRKTGAATAPPPERDKQQAPQPQTTAQTISQKQAEVNSQ